MKDKLIVIVGVGGTGGNLAAMLSRFINSQWEIVLMDADRVENHNLERQAFQAHDIGEFKAEAMSRKLNSATSARSSFKNVYLKDPKQLHNLTKKTRELIVVGCVDNHPARMKIESYFKELEKDERKNYYMKWLYVDSANELNNGEVVSVVKQMHEKKHVGSFRSNLYPKIKKSTKGDVTNKSCAVEISSGNEQQYSTNLQAAIICFRIIQNFINGKEIPKQVHFDLESWGMKNV